MKELFDSGHVYGNSKINHFRNHYELTRKNLMAKNWKRLKKKWEKEMGKKEPERFDFIPTTFELPVEYHMFVEEFKKQNGSVWIMKPIAKSQGKGIFLFTKIKDIEAWKQRSFPEKIVDSDGIIRDAPETYVVSRYITDPYLLSNRKFDLRVYTLVTSFNPLRVWVYRDGFARFSNTKYTLDSITDQYAHLTNVAVQKTAPDYDAEKGSKWSVCKLRRYLQALVGSKKVDEIFRQIDCIFLLSVMSAQKLIINDKHCFELYGYDILLDSQLKPWLLEINASPSLTASSKEDYDLKAKLVNDICDIVMTPNSTPQKVRVGDFDLIWNDGPVPPSDYPLDLWMIEAQQSMKLQKTKTICNSNVKPSLYPEYSCDDPITFVTSLPKLNSYLGFCKRQ
ncbi:putative tubulin polyglutamylase ttll9 [Cichlidogyrus casuarinus]|uniref:Tubulin--tyrosine ligase-like protein 9 n=1 Tax=Cichlidogyrus casuarinus TaxID=1844966 RepID=A0ABD2QNY7_9PLAT